MSVEISEGRSKRLTMIDDRTCRITLLPTLDSFTFDRHEVVTGTAELRLDFHQRAVSVVEAAGLRTCWLDRVDVTTYRAVYCTTMPFEVIVKRFACGSTQRKYPGLFADMTRFDPPVVKFDYRTEPEDQPVAEDYLRAAGHDPGLMKCQALRAHAALSDWLAPLLLVDICFIFGYGPEGELTLISEISPDCMRLRDGDGRSYDKDLFRRGASSEEIRGRWGALLDRVRRA